MGRRNLDTWLGAVLTIGATAVLGLAAPEAVSDAARIAGLRLSDKAHDAAQTYGNALVVVGVAYVVAPASAAWFAAAVFLVGGGFSSVMFYWMPIPSEQRTGFILAGWLGGVSALASCLAVHLLRASAACAPPEEIGPRPRSGRTLGTVSFLASATSLGIAVWQWTHGALGGDAGALAFACIALALVGAATALVLTLRRTQPIGVLTLVLAALCLPVSASFWRGPPRGAESSRARLARVDYDTGLYRGYREGRAFHEGTERRWLDAIGSWLPRAGATVLDVGCGTGRLAVPIARSLPVSVVAVDPSRGMLAQADRTATVGFVRGTAERLPLGDDSCDLALLSMVVHHLADLRAVGAELARVLRRGGRVLVRSCFRGRVDDICLYRFSPAARRVDEARLPSIDQVATAFAASGLAHVATRVVRQETDPSLAAHRARIAGRTMSTCTLMTEEEIHHALTAIDAAIRADPTPRPVVESIDLLVFESGDGTHPETIP